MMCIPIPRYPAGIFVSSRVREQLATGITFLLHIEKHLQSGGKEQTGLTSEVRTETLD